GAGGWTLGTRADILSQAQRARLVAGISTTPVAPDGGLPRELGVLLGKYLELLKAIASSEVIEKAASWRLRDELVGVLILRVFGDVYQSWPNRAKATGGGSLPVDPEVYAGADIALHYRDFDPRPLLEFLDHLVKQKWHIVTSVEQVDLDTLRL